MIAYGQLVDVHRMENWLGVSMGRQQTNARRLAGRVARHGAIVDTRDFIPTQLNLLGLFAVQLGVLLNGQTRRTEARIVTVAVHNTIGSNTAA